VVASSTVKAKVADFAGYRGSVKGVHDVDEIEFFAELPDKLRRPVPPGFKAKDKMVSFQFLKEPAEVGEVLGGRLKGRRALDNDHLGFEGPGFPEGDGGAFLDFLGGLKKAQVLGNKVGWEFGPAVGGRVVRVGDTLKSFHGKNEVRGSFFPEIQEILLGKWSVESFLDFDHFELLKKQFL